MYSFIDIFIYIHECWKSHIFVPSYDILYDIIYVHFCRITTENSTLEVLRMQLFTSNYVFGMDFGNDPNDHVCIRFSMTLANKFLFHTLFF